MSVPSPPPAVSINEARTLHQRACDMVRAGNYASARAIYHTLEGTVFPPEFRRLVENNRAVLAAVNGERTSALEQLQGMLTADPDFRAARDNLNRLSVEAGIEAPARQKAPPSSPRGKRIVLLSFFFNWPSQAGGIVHTIELARFLSRAGYEVTLLHPQFAPWRIGHVGPDCPVPVETVPFTDRNWNRADIQRRLREAVDLLNPECVMITDCWNFKPHLVEALSGYRVILRMQAHECLCPLNNLRIKPQPEGGMGQCPIHQLVFRDQCLKCVGQYGAFSGPLHQQDRLLSEVDSPAYETVLRRSLREAEAVLVLNPLIAETLRPYCRRVEVVT